MNDETLQRIQQVYGVENWSAGYFDINAEGHIVVRPGRGDPRHVDLKDLVDHLLTDKKLQLPLLIRFPQLLTGQLRALSAAYQGAIAQYGFKGQHYPVYPMKVNPRREVVEEFLRDGARCRIGLECGSKAELYAAIAQEQAPETLMLCNGFKDEAFIKTALLGVQAGKRVTIIVEKLNELKMVVKLAKETGVAPWIGLRAKLYSRGSGKWASSGGEAAKFGLTTSELLQCVRLLKAEKLDGQLKLLHFHIGSQITDIKRVKNAMKEAARVYAKLRQIGCGIEFLDIGGGLGVDYDGSQTRFESSVNYTVQEFANDVVYVIKAVCDDENVPHPNLVTESGRFMTAYHTVFITSIRDEIETFADDEPEVTIDADDPQVITELKDLCDGINGKNYAEYYHDALEHKDELHTQFNLGLISLEDRAKGEVLFWEACARALKESEADSFPDDEFEALKKILAQKYLCNFSLFQSIPDSWAIKQLPDPSLERSADRLRDVGRCDLRQRRQDRQVRGPQRREGDARTARLEGRRRLLPRHLPDGGVSRSDGEPPQSVRPSQRSPSRDRHRRPLPRHQTRSRQPHQRHDAVRPLREVTTRRVLPQTTDRSRGSGPAVQSHRRRTRHRIRSGSYARDVLGMKV